MILTFNCIADPPPISDGPPSVPPGEPIDLEPPATTPPPPDAPEDIDNGDDGDDGDGDPGGQFTAAEIADQFITTLTAAQAWDRFDRCVAAAWGTSDLSDGWGFDEVPFDRVNQGFIASLSTLLFSLLTRDCDVQAELLAALQRARLQH